MVGPKVTDVFPCTAARRGTTRALPVAAEPWQYGPVTGTARQLILVSGPPGAGKSTLGRALGLKLCDPIVDRECIGEPFSPNERGEGYTEEMWCSAHLRR